jgi:hypothetical protein
VPTGQKRERGVLKPRSGWRDLVEIMTWRKVSDMPARLRASYEKMLRDLLASIATADEDARAILDALALLPEPQQRAFLRAPLVASRLLGRRDGEPLTPGPIVKSLMAELALAGIDCELPEPAWAVLGNRRAGPGLAPQAATAALIPGTNIAIDTCGPIDFSVGDLRPLVHPTQAQRASIEQKLKEAARGIAATSRPAFGCWQQSVDAVALRTLVKPAASITSVALRYNARVTLLVNAHVPEVDAAELAGLLLHEAIHAMLFMWEETFGHFVVDRAAADDVRLASPWTGRPLKLSAFIHACMVWYGMYWFWKVASQRNHWPADRTREFMKAARRGFESGPLLAVLSGHMSFLSAGIVAALADIDTRMAGA